MARSYRDGKPVPVPVPAAVSGGSVRRRAGDHAAMAARAAGSLLAPLLALLSVLALAALLTLPAMAQQQAPDEDDVGFLTRTLQDLLSDAGRDVRIRGFQGALSSRARMDELTIADDEGVWLVLRDVVLDWNRAALLDRRVDVNELSAQEIHLLRPPVADDGPSLPSATAREPFSLPELPVSVRIGTLRAERVEIGAALTGQAATLSLQGSMRLADGEGSAAFVADRIDGQEGGFRFSGRFDNTTRQLALDLELTEGADGIAANLLGIPERPALSLSIAGEGPIHAFEAGISLATDGEERVSGQVTLLDETPDERLIDGLNFALDIGGDLRPLLAPDLHPFFGAESRLRAQGARSVEGLISLNELSVRTRTMQAVGRAALDEAMLPQLVDVSVRISDPEGAMVPLSGGDRPLSLHDAQMIVEFDAEQSPDWTILAEINRLRAPGIDMAQLVFEARGVLGVTQGNGTGTAPFDGSFEFAALGIDAEDPALQEAIGESVTGFMRLVWPGNGEPAEITGLGLEAANAVLSARGTLRGLTFDGFVEAEIPDLAPFSGLAGRALGGHLLATMRGPFNPLTGAFDLDLGLVGTDLRIDQAEFDSLMAGESMIGLQISRDVAGTELQGLRLRAGAMTLTAGGRITPGDTELGARFDIRDLGALGAGYGGRMVLEASYANDAGQERFGIEGSARDLRLGDLPGAAQLGALLRGETVLSAQAGRADGVLSVERARIEGPQLALAASGRLAGTDTDLRLSIERLVLDGMIEQLAGRVAGEARLSGDDGARRLAVELASIGALRSDLPPLDALLGQGVRLDLRGHETGDGGFSLADLRLSARGLSLRGSGAQRADGAASLTLAARIDRLADLMPGPRGLAADGPAELDISLSRAAAARDFQTRFTLSGPARLSVQGDGQIAPDGRLAMRFDGAVDAGIANPMIAPATMQGLVRIDGRLDGPPALQSLRATLRADDGRFINPVVGFGLESISAEAEITGSMARLRLRLSGRATRGGRISAEGSVFLEGRRDVDLSVSAEAVRVYQPRLFEASVSGTVRVTGPLQGGALISGRAMIDQAEIRIPNAPLARQGDVPEGLVHAGEGPGVRRTRQRAGLALDAHQGAGQGPGFRLDLALDAPSRVFVRGRGLDAELGGSLRLAGTTRAVIPSGGFSLIRGRLDLLGNRFALTDGSASLVGNFIPFVRLIATTESGGVSTSIILEGEADAPEISFRSSPELPEDEVLARLLFGRSLTTLSPFQAAQLGLSIATLAGRGDGGILARTRLALGLDDLDITSDEEGVAALRAGRYLTERVYSDVTVDSEGRGEVSINLDLTPSVTLRARTDTDGRTGLGVFFERDY